MRVWIDKDRFAAHLPHLVEGAARPAVPNYGAIDPKLAKANLRPDLYAVFEKLHAAGKPVYARELAEAYASEVKEGVHAAAGTNRWISRVEARALPASARAAYAQFRERERYSRAYELALDEPFPRGRADHDLFFQRYLPMTRKRAMLALIERGDVIERTLDLQKQQGKDSVKVTHGGRTVIATATEDGLKVEGGTHGVPIEYEKQSVFERLAGMRRSLPAAVRGVVGKDEKRTPSENLNDRFRSGTDVDDLAVLALGLDALAGGGKTAELQAILDDHRRAHDAACGEYLRRAGAVEALREIVAGVREHGPQSLGDADLDLTVRGRTLKMENNASGAIWKVDLEALARGELSIPSFDGRTPEGVVDIAADGTVRSMASFRSLFGLAFDIDWAKRELRELSSDPT